MKYHRLFQPYTIKNMELKNRLIMPAINMVYTPDGSANAKVSEFYWRRAEGGCGLIIVGGVKFDDHGGGTSMLSLQNDSLIPSFQQFTKGMHERGAKVAVQLFHAGRYAKPSSLKGKEALAPSAVYSGYSKNTPKEMTRDEIKNVIRLWADAAVRAKKAGFDAVEVVASAGYLVSQFLSPFTNLRTDEYGGSWENRTRFGLELLAALRAALGDDYPIIFRIAGNDFMKGGNTNESAVEFAKLLDAGGCDLINVTGGWHETQVPQLPGEVPRAGYSYLAALIKKAVKIPVMASNRINNPQVAEELLAMGRADFIGVGRVLIADPDWPKKAQEGKVEEIRHCVGCNQGCLAKTFFGKPVECLVNGMAGKEFSLKFKPAETRKKILVVGAGPAGMEFAVNATQRGHSVVIWEKSDKLGGQVRLTAAPVGKEEFGTLIDYHRAMLAKLGISVEFNKEATPENVAAAGYDEVVVATGATPRTIPLDNAGSNIPVVSADSVLAGEFIPGKDVVVIGGGAVGCETAQLIARQGSLNAEQLMFLSVQKAETPEMIFSLLNSTDRKVTIVEMLDTIGNGFDLGCGWPVFKDLKRLGVAQLKNAQVTKVTQTEAVVTQKIDSGTKEIRIPCDTVILAVGSAENNGLYNALKDKMTNVHCLGDAVKVGKVLDAIGKAVDLAYVI